MTTSGSPVARAAPLAPPHQPAYSLGVPDSEMARLDAQADSIARATSLLLPSAGIRPGMRVLDLGTGLGHVAFQMGELVGPTGTVVGIDQAEALLAVAEQRRVAAGIENVRFFPADVRTFHDDRRFDAIVGRLILFHLPDAVAVLRHHLHHLADGGRMVMVDFDCGSVRTEPAGVLVDTVLRWIVQAFRQAGADPMVGTRLGALLREAGLGQVETFGVQDYFPPEDPTAARLLAGAANSLAPLIIGAGLATEEELEFATLVNQLNDQVQRVGAVALTPTVLGAWGQVKPPGATRPY